MWFVGSFVSHVDRVLCHSSHLLVARAINTRVEPPPRLVLPTGLRYGFPSGRLIRRPAHSSRPLVAMSSAIQRLTVETMSVFTDESHAEAFREVGLEHLIGGETKLEFTTLGRSKRVESVCIIVGEPEARRFDIDVLLAFDLLASVPEFHNHDTRSGIDLNATLEF